MALTPNAKARLAQDAQDSRVTHVVVGSAGAGAGAPPARGGQHAVGEDWLLGCLAQGRRLPEAAHAPATPATPDSVGAS
jgi:hypothetical protein